MAYSPIAEFSPDRTNWYCKALIKTGARKGRECCAKTYGERTCKQHSKKSNTPPSSKTNEAAAVP